MKVSECPNIKVNNTFCSCSYPGCPRHAQCCQCVQYHRRNNELPACFFPKEAEREYDRSFRNFIKVWSS